MFKNLFFSIAILSLATIYSCSVYNQTRTTEIELPPEYVLPDSIAQNINDTLIPWNEFFRDTVLVRLISNAFENNFDIQTANKEIAINEKLHEQSKLAYLPSVNLGLLSIKKEWHSRYSRYTPEDEVYEARNKEIPKDLYLNESIYNSGVALDWEVDIWGKFRNQKKEAQALYLQSYEMRKAIQTEVVATIAEDYYTLLTLDEQLEVAKENRVFRDNTLQMIQLQYDAGEVSALAVHQARSQVLEAEALIPKLERQRAIQENNLRLLTGELPKYIEIKAKLPALEAAYKEIEGLPLYLVQNRPDVVMAKYRLQAANARVGVTQVERYPNLTISLSGGLDSQLGKNWFKVPGSLFGEFFGGLTAPIFNNKKLKTNFEIAKLKREEAEINFQRNVYSAVVDIQNTLVSLDKREEELRVAILQQEVARKSLQSAQMLFRSGFATYLEVITAQSDALDKELSLVQARTNLLMERIQLYRALGGGWR